MECFSESYTSITSMTGGCNDSGIRMAPTVSRLGYLGYKNTLVPTKVTHPCPRALAKLHPPARDKNKQGIEESHMIQL